MCVTDSNHKVSTSDHPLFQLALRYSNRFVTVSLVYGTLLTFAALDVLEWTPVVLNYVGVFQLEGETCEGGGDASKRRSGALGLATAGVMGFLVAAMVRRHCRRDADKTDTVRVVWHELFKYTHMGRAIMAAMTAVLTWRGLEALSEFRPAAGGVGRVPAVIVVGAILSMLAAATFHYLHFRIKACYMECSRIKRAALKRS